MAPSPIEEISLLKSVSDLVQIAVARTGTPTAKTKTSRCGRARRAPAGDDTVFRSPRMVELVRIAERLAAATAARS